MHPVIPAARSWMAVLVIGLLALAAAPAAGRDDESRAGHRAAGKDGVLTLEVSVRDFIELQRMDDGERRERLGLPDSCSPGMTALASLPSSHIFVVVACSPRTDD